MSHTDAWQRALGRAFLRWLAEHRDDYIFPMARPENADPGWVAYHCPLAKFIAWRYGLPTASVGLARRYYTIHAAPPVPFDGIITDPGLAALVERIDDVATDSARAPDGSRPGSGWRDVTALELRTALNALKGDSRAR